MPSAIRILRNLAGVAAMAGLVVGLAGGTAHADANGSVSGDVNLTSCTGTPSVYVTNGTIGKTLTPTQTSVGRWHYAVGDLPAGDYTVYGSLPFGPGFTVQCPGGNWSVRSVAAHVSPGLTTVAADLVYLMPTKTITVNGAQITGGAYATLAFVRLKLNDFGPQHGDTHQLDDDSYAEMASHTQVARATFNLPEGSYNVKPCGTCASLGHAHFYVDGAYYGRYEFTDAHWSGGLRMTYDFNSPDGMVKGFLANSAGHEDDKGMPDGKFPHGTVRMTMIPQADGSGGITFVPLGVPTFVSHIQPGWPTYYCTFRGWNICKALSSYESVISSAVANAIRNTVTSAALRKEMSAHLRPVLDQLGIGYVTWVTMQGDNVVIESA